LLYVTILTDTFSFDPNQKGTRWTEEDRIGHDLLRSTYFEFMDEAAMMKGLNLLKYDVTGNVGFGLHKLLRQDYKEYFSKDQSLLGYSVLMISVEDLVQSFDTRVVESEL